MSSGLAVMRSISKSYAGFRSFGARPEVFTKSRLLFGLGKACFLEETRQGVQE